jgi:hypothetical protein
MIDIMVACMRANTNNSMLIMTSTRIRTMQGDHAQYQVTVIILMMNVLYREFVVHSHMHRSGTGTGNVYGKHTG